MGYSEKVQLRKDEEITDLLAQVKELEAYQSGLVDGAAALRACLNLHIPVADAARKACKANIVHEPCKAPGDIERIRRIHGGGDIKTMGRLEDALAELDADRKPA